MCIRTCCLCSLQWMPQQVIDLQESCRLWQKTIWGDMDCWKQGQGSGGGVKANGFDFLLHESTNSRAVSHVLAVIWPLAIDSWHQHLFSAAVNFLIPLLANLEEMCCYKSKLPSRVWREWQDKLCGGSLHHLQFKQTYHTITKKPPTNTTKKPSQETKRNFSTYWKS